MGNIEIQEPKRKKIFEERSTSSRIYFGSKSIIDHSHNKYKMSRSTILRQYEPLTERKQRNFQRIRNQPSKIHRTPRTTRITDSSTPRRSPAFLGNKWGQYGNVSSRNNESTIQYQRSILEQTNRLNYQNTMQKYQKNYSRCQQIIKKVRTFNDFLNQVKRRIKYQTSQTNTSKQTNNSSKLQHLDVTLKLENQKIQLEKYKQLFTRELSRQHSIENIYIEGNNKQKIVRIQYQKKLKNKVYQKWNQVSKKVNQLGQIIIIANQQNEQSQRNRKQQNNIQNRVKFISKLFKRFNNICQQQKNNQSKLLTYLNQSNQQQSQNQLSSDQQIYNNNKI